jgi:hypothetical protein
LPGKRKAAEETESLFLVQILHFMENGKQVIAKLVPAHASLGRGEPKFRREIEI